MIAVRAALLVLLAAGAARADGGTVRVQQDAGPLRITVFSAPEPLREGSADFSVLVQRDGDAVLDAEVAIRLDGPAPLAPIEARATREAATNKLLYAALVELPAAGTWQVRATVRERDGSAHVVAAELVVAARAPRLQTLWPYLALPLLAVVVFATREWLLRRRRAP